jgi:VWFA-related protein
MNWWPRAFFPVLPMPVTFTIVAMAAACTFCLSSCALNDMPQPALQPVASPIQTEVAHTAGLPQIGAVPMGGAQNYAPSILSALPPGECTQDSVPPAELAAVPGYSQYQVLVRNHDGAAITNLPYADFAISLSGRPVPLAFFHSAANSPISIVLLIDTSGSMTSKMEWIRSGLSEFIAELSPFDEIALFAYSSHTFLLAPLNTEHDEVISQLKVLHAYGQTATYDSTVQSIQLLQHAAHSTRALLLISDGMDNASTTDRNAVAQALRQSGIAFYAIAIGDPTVTGGEGFELGPFKVPPLTENNRMDAGALHQLADASAGRVWIVNTKSPSPETAFVNDLTAIAQSLGRSYAIGIIMPRWAKHAAPVDIAVKGHPDVSVVACPTAASNAPVVAPAAR